MCRWLALPIEHGPKAAAKLPATGCPRRATLRPRRRLQPPPRLPAFLQHATCSLLATMRSSRDLERANFLFFWEQANPDTGSGEGPLQRPRQRQPSARKHRRDWIRVDRALHWRQPRIHFLCAGAGPRAGHVAFPLEKAAQPARILLSLGQHQYRRAAVGIGNILDRYCHSALRRAHLPRSISFIRRSTIWRRRFSTG